MYDISIEKADNDDIEKVKILLREEGLEYDDAEYTAIARLKGEIVGTCSFSGKVIKCFAVKEKLKGEGISLKLITHITNEMFDRGIYGSFIFTKPLNAQIFKTMGYRIVHSVDEVALLEGGTFDVKKYTVDMFLNSGLGNEKKAAIVMNCNPFTLGHRFLIEKASNENEKVVVFIVEEEKSVFPFNIRYNLVKEGVSDLKNVVVIPGGNYIISSATFPTYFIKHFDERLSAYTKLDAGIFGKYIAPQFNIVKRYVGTEPYCKVTSKYNEALMEVLPNFNITLELVKRLSKDERAISASMVRGLIKEEKIESIRDLVPDVTYNYLISDDAKPIIERIKNGR
ncbi:[citrate (pro-3S)-lyase] ligase [Caloramator sp. E03]|uniref:[citrate (pro-3S)-lyase] ligase n=1 Tax=Caloramator sp. E03 TaxID=2576307 RepID=UPI001110428F|nr:[citrate (pro-3S)-lyase] ligase [Caloramator sp. E03]QCX33049.1 [citrate (pro-3S)-lyase] ligase [Caloramator sp. E03]